MASPKRSCREHEPILTVAAGGTALCEVCVRCWRIRRNDTEAEPIYHFPRTTWQRKTVERIQAVARRVRRRYGNG